jgi:zinc protease
LAKPEILIEESHAIPICHVVVMVRSGASVDPEGHEGLVRHAAELMRRGAGGRSRTELDATLDELGASIDVVVGADSAGFMASGLSRHLPRLVELLVDVLARPRFDEDEHERLRRESLATLDDVRDDDSSLCGRYWDRSAYGGHPYGRTTLGTQASLAALTLDDARAWWKTRLLASHVLIGFAGDVTRARAEALAEQIVGALPGGLAPDEPARPLTVPALPGRRTILVDKPERTQSQILVGHTAPPRAHADWLALSVGAAVFGGTFTSRLMSEVRVKRGWSYGASCRLGRGRHGAAFRMRVFPSNELTASTLTLVLELFEQIVAEGVTAAEVEFALGYLSGSWPFELVTPSDRLGKQLDTILLGLEPGTYARHLKLLAAISADQVNEAIRRWWKPADAVIALTATADDMLPRLQGLPLGELQVVAYDSY